MLGISKDEPAAQKKFADKYQLPFPVLLPTNQMREGASAFGPIRELPSTFVVDREGRVAAAFTGRAAPEKLRRLVERLLK